MKITVVFSLQFLLCPIYAHVWWHWSEPGYFLDVARENVSETHLIGYVRMDLLL